MIRPIAVVTADNHLRPTTWARHPALKGDAYVSFRQIVDLCVTSLAPLILLGDLFDKARPDSYSVAVYLEQAARLAEVGQKIIYIEGNHDQADPPWASLAPNAVSGAGAFQLGGLSFYGVHYTPAALLAEQLAQIPTGTQIVLAHQSWQELQGIGATDGQISMLPFGCTLLTGDYHVHGENTFRAANGEAVRVCSPGSTAMQATNEDPNKYCYTLHHHPPADFGLQVWPLVTRRFAAVQIDTATDLDELLAAYQSADRLVFRGGPSTDWPEISKPVLRVLFNDSVPEAYQRLQAAIGDTCFLFLEPIRAEQTTIVEEGSLPANDSADATEQTLAVVRQICPSPAAARDVEHLLLTSDAKAELARMFTAFTSPPATQPAT